VAALTGVEVWLNGTKDELRAAWAALHRIGTVTQLGDLHPLEVPGRFRTYMRVAVATSAVPTRHPHDTTGTAEPAPSLPLAG
jgi:hypothetical protein